MNFPELERVDVPRHKAWGGPMLPHPETGRVAYYKRATTVAETLSDKRAIEAWKLRCVAKGVATNASVRKLAASYDISADKDEFDKACERALEIGGANDASATGTAHHTFTSQLEWMGQKAPEHLDDWLYTSVPMESIPDLMAYSAAMAQAGLQMPVEYIERTTLNTEIMAAGTFDGPVWRPGWAKPRVGDKKTGQRYYDKRTGKEVFYGVDGWCIQLAIYAHGERLCPAKWDDTRGADQYEPMLDFDQEVGVIISLPAGSGECTIYEVDLEAGWYAAKLSKEVLDWRKRKNLHRVLQDTVRPVVTVNAATLPADPFAEAIDAGPETIVVHTAPTDAELARIALSRSTPDDVANDALRELEDRATQPTGIAALAREARVQGLYRKIAEAPSSAALAELWELNQDCWTEALSDAGAVRMAVLEMSGAEV